MSKYLEDLEKELTEIEPEIEVESVPKKKLITGIIFGYLFWLTIYMLIYIYNNPETYSSISDINNVIMKSIIDVPALGYQILEEILTGYYIQGIELVIPALIAGFAAGLISRRATNGVLVGSIIWFIGLLIACTLLTYNVGISIENFIESILNILNNSLFLDPLILALTGAIGGLIMSRK